MDQKIVPCDFCGAAIQGWEFENGRAVVLLKRTYCPRCIDERIRKKRRTSSSSSSHLPPADPLDAAPARWKPLVVCVDDDRPVLSSLRRLLRAEPYDLWTTPDPEEALGWIRTREVHVVVADYRMPVMSGSSLLHVIRATSPNTGRLMLTSFPEDPCVLAGAEMSLMRICAKPWDDVELRQTIRELLPAMP